MFIVNNRAMPVREVSKGQIDRPMVGKGTYCHKRKSVEIFCESILSHIIPKSGKHEKEFCHTEEDKFCVF